jgi:hypothetical protein
MLMYRRRLVRRDEDSIHPVRNRLGKVITPAADATIKPVPRAAYRTGENAVGLRAYAPRGQTARNFHNIPECRAPPCGIQTKCEM